jgi:Gpi18-like mannosyltransferase
MTADSMGQRPANDDEAAAPLSSTGSPNGLPGGLVGRQQPSSSPKPELDSNLLSVDSDSPRDVARWVVATVAVLAVGTAFRIWMISEDALGHAFDTDIFLSWARSLSRLGLSSFYGNVGLCDYPPIGMLTIWSVGEIATLADVLNNDHVMHALLKVPACLADLGIALVLLVEGKRLLGRSAGLAACALYFLNPVAWYNSAYWGQIDAIHSMFMLAAVVLANRGRWGLSGLMTALAVLAKFQAVVIVPLILFDAYRYRRWRGVGRVAIGSMVALFWVCLPFALSGTLADVLSRSYVNVVGQYDYVSSNAFNLWYLLGDQSLSDTSIPRWFALAASDGQPRVGLDQSWLLSFDYRKISLIFFSAAVAVLLSLHAFRTDSIRRLGTGGLLVLAFFLFPTEMHERYAHPAMALLPIWAVSDRWRERVFFVLSGLLLLNLSEVQPAGAVGMYIAAMILGLFFCSVVLPRRANEANERKENEVTGRKQNEANGRKQTVTESSSEPSKLVTAFQVAALMSVVGLVSVGVMIGQRVQRAEASLRSSSSVYLSGLSPVSHHQGWGELQANTSVVGSVMVFDDTVYLRGLGTHAPSRITYDIPSDVSHFRAIAGIDRSAKGQGTATVFVELDGRPVFESSIDGATKTFVPIDVPLDGAKRLTLRADATADGNRQDHVSWALARFE